MNKFIALIIISLTISSQARYLQEGAISSGKANLIINGEKVVENGKVSFKKDFLCISGGVPANSVQLENALVIDGDRCFPNIYIYGQISRFNKFTKFFYFRLHGTENSGFSKDALIRVWLSSESSPEDLDADWALYEKRINESKSNCKAKIDALFDDANKINSLISSISASEKSIPEIQNSIEVLKQNRINLLKKKQDEELSENSAIADCNNNRVQQFTLRQNIVKLNNEAEDLDDKFNNEKLALIEIQEFVTKKLKVIAETTETKNNAYKECDKLIALITPIIPNMTGEMKKAKVAIDDRKLDVCHKVLDGIVNLS